MTLAEKFKLMGRLDAVRIYSDSQLEKHPDNKNLELLNDVLHEVEWATYVLYDERERAFGEIMRVKTENLGLRAENVKLQGIIKKMEKGF